MAGLANSENGTEDVERVVETGWVQWVCLAIAAVILVAFRLHAFDLPLETDESNYAYIGGRLLAGDRMYVDVWDHQPPGVFALFAGAIALFGNAPEVFRWMAVGFSLVSLGLVYGIALRCGGRGAAVLAAMLFALASSDPGTAGEGCNREIYMNTLLLAAWYLALRPGGASGWAVFGSGLALGLGSALKTILAVHWGFLALWIGWWAWTRAGDRNRAAAVARSLALFGAGPAIVWMAVFGYFAATSRLAESIEAILLFNLSYSEGAEGFFARFARFFAPIRHPFIFDSALPLWLGTAAALLWLIADAVMSRSAQVIGILGLLLAGFVATCLPAQFWPHYYYLLIPPMAVAVAVAVARMASRFWRYSGETSDSLGEGQARPVRPSLIVVVRWVAIALVFAVIPVGLLGTQYRDYLSQRPFGITVKRYNSRDFWGRAHGENVRRVTDPGDTVFVFGSDTAIYYYSRRRCASRFSMITGLRSGYSGVDERRAVLMEELRRDPPRLILVLFDEPPFAEWREFLHEVYGEPIGWDYNDRTGKAIMFVLARKDAPVEPIDWNWDRAQVGGWNLGEDPPP